MSDKMDLLKELLKDPEIVEQLLNQVDTKVLKEKVEESGSAEVFEVDESDIPKAEQDLNNALKPTKTARVGQRRAKTIMEKTCVCGRKETVTAGSVLDRSPFLCNRCITKLR